MALRQLNSCFHQLRKDTQCVLCGLFQYSTGSALKTTLFATPAHFKHAQYYKSLRKATVKVQSSKQICEDTYSLLTAICQKFTFTLETLALGLQIYQSVQKMNSNERFWASACLILAAKAIELDKNVPYLNRYQRYSDKSFSQTDYEQAERSIFEAMNFQVQHSTFVTFVNFFLTCGVIFKQDHLNQSLLEFVEDDILIKAKEIVKKGNFMKYQPQKLALSIIKETRVKYNLMGWNDSLAAMTGFKQEEIEILTNEGDILKEVNKNSNSSIKLSEIKGLNIRRKYENLIKSSNEKSLLQKYSSTNKNLKENSYSISKTITIAANRSRPNILYSVIDHYSSINPDLNKRR